VVDILRGLAYLIYDWLADISAEPGFYLGVFTGVAGLSLASYTAFLLRPHLEEAAERYKVQKATGRSDLGFVVLLFLDWWKEFAEQYKAQKITRFNGLALVVGILVCVLSLLAWPSVRPGLWSGVVVGMAGLAVAASVVFQVKVWWGKVTAPLQPQRVTHTTDKTPAQMLVSSCTTFVVGVFVFVCVVGLIIEMLMPGVLEVVVLSAQSLEVAPTDLPRLVLAAIPNLDLVLAVGAKALLAITIVTLCVLLYWAAQAVWAVCLTFWQCSYSANSHFWLLCRATMLPLPRVRWLLEQWLVQDWEAALHNVHELLKYTRQSIPVAGAVSSALTRLPEDKTLGAVATLIESPMVLRSASTSPLKAMWLVATGVEARLPAKWRERLLVVPYLRIPARAAAAGFWYLYQREPAKAVRAFSTVRLLPRGKEMYSLALALATAYDVKDLEGIASLAEQFEFAAEDGLPPVDVRLHPSAWRALGHIQRAALGAQTVRQSVSRAVRSQALIRAQGEMAALLERVDITSEAERDILQEIASRWQEALLAAAREVGQTAAKPVTNPYILNDPVVGRGFVDREETLRRLEELWAGSQVPPSVVLFGQRRMGKTSILRNLPGHLGASVHLAYVDLNLIGDAPGGTGDVVLALVDGARRALEMAGQTGPKVDPAALTARPYRAFEQYLRSVQEMLGEDRLILAMDEFEQLEKWMDDGRLPQDFLKVLRSYIQMDPHIAFAFAGSHMLEEMTADYFEPLFASVIPVKVRFLSRGAVSQLLANPADDFPLDYAPEALEQIWQLTAGQPNLVQLVGHRLVSRFNDLAFEQARQPEACFTAADVQAVVEDPEFLKMGRCYFTGVWGQAGQNPPGQQAVLRALAAHPEGLTSKELAAATRLDEETLNAALAALKQHDVVVEEAGRWRYAVELMRRWVSREQGRPSGSPGLEVNDAAFS
jgi:hypothetical protein